MPKRASLLGVCCDLPCTAHHVTSQDIQLSFLIDSGAARGRLTRLGPEFENILGHYPPLVAYLLGETMALAAGLAGGLKYTGVFTLQVQGDGPVSLLVADVTSEGNIRGYARYDELRLTAAEADPTVPHLLGQGYLAFTVDQGPDTDRYQGIVELDGATLGECAQNYFRSSEQIASAIMLSAQGPRDGHGWRAGCLILQRMPLASGPGRDNDEADEAWRRAVILLASTRAEELLDPTLAPERLLFRLYHDDQLKLLDAKMLNARCRCSAERVAVTLRSFPRTDIEDLRDEHGQVVVTCEFCHAAYRFDEADLDRLYAS